MTKPWWRVFLLLANHRSSSMVKAPNAYTARSTKIACQCRWIRVSDLLSCISKRKSGPWLIQGVHAVKVHLCTKLVCPRSGQDLWKSVVFTVFLTAVCMSTSLVTASNQFVSACEFHSPVTPGLVTRGGAALFLPAGHCLKIGFCVICLAIGSIAGMTCYTSCIYFIWSWDLVSLIRSMYQNAVAQNAVAIFDSI